jgi:hypothetical protein
MAATHSRTRTPTHTVDSGESTSVRGESTHMYSRTTSSYVEASSPDRIEAEAAAAAAPARARVRVDVRPPPRVHDCTLLVRPPTGGDGAPTASIDVGGLCRRVLSPFTLRWVTRARVASGKWRTLSTPKVVRSRAFLEDRRC